MKDFRSQNYKSLIEPFLERVKDDPEQTAVIFIDDEEAGERITCGQLHAAACAQAGALKETGIKPGDRVIIALRHCPELLYAFLGVLYSGAVPSIVGYKGPMVTYESYIDRIKNLVVHAKSRMVMTLPEVGPGLKKCLSDFDCLITEVGKVEGRVSGGEMIPALSHTTGTQMAYLQYTSGTTGIQKGVKLSHRAVIDFIEAFSQVLRIADDDVVVSWLPLYHDFGLFAGLVTPLLVGIPVVLISPFKWVRRPWVLPQVIHEYRGTLSFMPNFGFNHSVTAIPDSYLQGLDLSSLRMLMNGSEPIRHKSLDKFYQRFAPFGLKQNAVVTAYGMAENTLAATVSPLGEPVSVEWLDVKDLNSRNLATPVNSPGEKTIPVVSCGKPIPNLEIAVVDENRDRLPERRVGEIIIKSAYLFSGYYDNQPLTEKVLSDGWYFTGDLGYISGGHLFFCGRKKDLIIVGGKNIYPEDIEGIADTIPGICRERSVGLGVIDDELGTERIVMICDLKRSAADSEKPGIERELRQKVFMNLDVTLGEVHLMRKGWVVKTQNGKIARSANREKYEELIRERNAAGKKD